MIKYALISVYNKVNIVNFSKFLSSIGFKILSTNGTAKLLLENNINVVKISKYINFPEILNGRVKTLHPKLYSGILSRRNNINDNLDLKKMCFFNIDLVVVNLYPFKEISLNKESSLEKIIDNIDIGGVTLLRSSAKNYKYVISIYDPNDYEYFLNNFKKDYYLSNKKRFFLAKKTFKYILEYDKCIYNYFKYFNIKKC